MAEFFYFLYHRSVASLSSLTTPMATAPGRLYLLSLVSTHSDSQCLALLDLVTSDHEATA